MTDFSKYEYNDLVAAITSYVQTAAGWGNAYQSSVGQTIIQVIAQMVDQLNYSLERRTAENFMTTAQLQSSIWALASAIGYRPTRKTSASGFVSMGLVTSNGAPLAPVGTVTVPKYSQLTYSIYNFVNVNDIVIAPGQVSPTTNIEIKEGTISTQTVDPTVAPFSTNGGVIIPNYTNVENTSIYITDADGEWYDVTTSINGASPIGALSFAQPTDRVYDLKISYNPNTNSYNLLIVFGDGNTGLLPTLPLTIKWIVSSGSAVNIQQGGLPFALPSNTVADNIPVTPPNTYLYSIVNGTGAVPSPITGGENEETTTAIQTNSPDYVKSADRAVIGGDYRFWAIKSALGGIVDAAVYGQQEAGIVPYQMNNVWLTYLTENGTPMDDDEADLLRNYMANLETMTTYLILQPATVIPVQVIFRIKKNTSVALPQAYFYTAIQNSIDGFFPLADGSLGETIDNSGMVAYFNNYTLPVNGVNVNAAQWVTVVNQLMLPFVSPITTSSITSTCTYGTTGDVYSIYINGTQYDYTQLVGDTDATDVATGLAAALVSATAVAVSQSAGVLTISSAVPQTTFTISNDGTTVPANLYTPQVITLPPYLLANQNTTSIETILPGSVKIIEMDTGITEFIDDGNGNIAGGSDNLNYVSGLMTINVLPIGNYMVGYEQDLDSNIMNNAYCAVEYLPAPITWTANTSIDAGQYVYPSTFVVGTALGLTVANTGSTVPVNVVVEPITEQYQIVVNLTLGTTGDDYTLVVNGTPYTYAQGGSDTIEDVAIGLAAAVTAAGVTTSAFASEVVLFGQPMAFISENAGITGSSEPSWNLSPASITTDGAGPTEINFRCTFPFSTITVF